MREAPRRWFERGAPGLGDKLPLFGEAIGKVAAAWTDGFATLTAAPASFAFARARGKPCRNLGAAARRGPGLRVARRARVGERRRAAVRSRLRGERRRGPVRRRGRRGRGTGRSALARRGPDRRGDRRAGRPARFTPASPISCRARSGSKGSSPSPTCRCSGGRTPARSWRRLRLKALGRDDRSRHPGAARGARRLRRAPGGGPRTTDPPHRTRAGRRGSKAASRARADDPLGGRGARPDDRSGPSHPSGSDKCCRCRATPPPTSS